MERKIKKEPSIVDGESRVTETHDIRDDYIALIIDKINSELFREYNDTEFTELVPTLSTLSIEDLMVLYNDLYNDINTGKGSIIIDYGKLIRDGTFNYKFIFSENAKTVLMSGNVSLPDNIYPESGEPNALSHTYIASASLGYVHPINEPFRLIHDTIVDLYDVSSSLDSEWKLSNAESRALKAENGLLEATIKSLTDAPATFGFQVKPDYITFIGRYDVKLAVTGGTEPYRVEISDQAAANLSVSVGEGIYSKEVYVKLKDELKAGLYYFNLADIYNTTEIVGVNISTSALPPITPPIPFNPGGDVYLQLSGENQKFIFIGGTPYYVVEIKPKTSASSYSGLSVTVSNEGIAEFYAKERGSWQVIITDAFGQKSVWIVLVKQ